MEVVWSQKYGKNTTQQSNTQTKTTERNYFPATERRVDKIITNKKNRNI